MWSLAGFALVTFADAAMKSEGEDGIFFHWRNAEDAFVGIVASLLIFLFWPLFIILMGVLALRPDLDPTFKAPLVRAPTGKPRYRIRMLRLDLPFWQPPEHEAEVVTRMIRLRLKKDPRLAGEPPPWRWPMQRIWDSTEAHLLELVRGYLALCEDGLGPADIVARMEKQSGGIPDEPPDVRLRPYLAWRIRQADPEYIVLGRRVFSPALRLAIRWARRQSQSDEVLPSDWLGDEITSGDVEPAFEGLFFPAGPRPENWREALEAKRREWRLLTLRMREGDRVLQYAEPVNDDMDGFGEHGIALVRNGEAITWVAAIALLREPEGTQ